MSIGVLLDMGEFMLILHDKFSILLTLLAVDTVLPLARRFVPSDSGQSAMPFASDSAAVQQWVC
jgi:hypothetical protein